ncbi:flagellar hook-length control protein FliK [Pacificoceanicola onchidii]|uniref:flagellar hook-length control protein FliK n=1 Tax=Pacificoceanicola onchidii TaxID=2562685 RepID=UPI0010A62FDB|nr:flagellar hook-length control protein FliK [Pacificoceanicola onchidii]
MLNQLTAFLTQNTRSDPPIAGQAKTDSADFASVFEDAAERSRQDQHGSETEPRKAEAAQLSGDEEASSDTDKKTEQGRRRNEVLHSVEGDRGHEVANNSAELDVEIRATASASIEDVPVDDESRARMPSADHDREQRTHRNFETDTGILEEPVAIRYATGTNGSDRLGVSHELEEDHLRSMRSAVDDGREAGIGEFAGERAYKTGSETGSINSETHRLAGQSGAATQATLNADAALIRSESARIVDQMGTSVSAKVSIAPMVSETRGQDKLSLPAEDARSADRTFAFPSSERVKKSSVSSSYGGESPQAQQHRARSLPQAIRSAVVSDEMRPFNGQRGAVWETPGGAYQAQNPEQTLVTAGPTFPEASRLNVSEPVKPGHATVLTSQRPERSEIEANAKAGQPSALTSNLKVSLDERGAKGRELDTKVLIGGSTSDVPVKPGEAVGKTDTVRSDPASMKPAVLGTSLELLSQERIESITRAVESGKPGRRTLLAPSFTEMQAQSAQLGTELRHARLDKSDTRINASETQVKAAIPGKVHSVRAGQAIGAAAPGQVRQPVDRSADLARQTFETEEGFAPARVDDGRVMSAQGSQPLVSSQNVRPQNAVIMRQILDKMPKLSEGKIEIRLNPEELGRVRMQMISTDLGLSVQVQADRPETLDLLRRNVDQLARELADVGYETAGFSFGDSSPQNEQDDRNAHARPNGTAASSHVDPELSENGPVQRQSAATDGLDIRL